MNATHSKIASLLGFVLAASLAATPAFAEKGGNKHEEKAQKHAEKHQEKAEKHAEKAHEKAMKHAEKRHDKDMKHAEKQQEKAAKHAAKRHEDVRIGGYFDDRHRGAVRNYYVTQYPAGKACPPGLAKKNNGCLPPGQAKKLVAGQPLPVGIRTYTVPQPVLVQLPPPPIGHRYVRVGNDIVLVSSQRQLIVDIISGLFG